jgi:hypothetical protein
MTAMLLTLVACGKQTTAAPAHQKNDQSAAISSLKAENTSLKESRQAAKAASQVSSRAASTSSSAVAVAARTSTATSEMSNASAQSSSAAYEKGPDAPQLLSEDQLPWGGAGQQSNFDAAMQKQVENGQRLAGFKLLNGSRYDVYFQGSDAASMMVDVATGDVSDY